MTYNETRAKSIRKYLATKSDFRVWTTPENKERIKALAQEAGQSVNAYILEAIERRIAEDQKNNKKP